ncbi:MAG: DHHA1 domain-containing protein, partial [Desulfurivibrionaceae bacterium]|nr:DHHA1 domain-containing protein [Desulfurivibrionaceae bacterium]
LNIAALPKLRAGLANPNSPEPILVTVDCGISSHAEVMEARNLGFRVIITDHHRPSLQLPAADAIVNPLQKECSFPDKNLAGVGLAFYLLIGLRSRLTELGYWPAGRQPNLKRYLDLVAIGTIADQVPLTGANRIMVKAGLEVMSSNPRPGLGAILKNSGITDFPITAEQIAFRIAPRINAAGRVADPGLALEVLLAENETAAAEPARLLEKANNYRKELSDEIYREACRQAEIRVEEGGATLVLVGENWHVGVIGLIASRLAERYQRPTVVLSRDDKGLARGSARSAGELDLLARIAECSDLLAKYGGHKGAAGLTIRCEMIAAFTEQFEDSVNRIMKGTKPRPAIYVNLRASIGELMDRSFLEFFEKLEPFGMGNPEPVFCNSEENLSLRELQKVGNNSLRFKVDGNGSMIKGVGFGMAELLPIIKDVPISLAYKIFKNKFRGKINWEIRAEDIKPDG